jgi:predicted 2-oxoglutarate/Fe(II)-dependent dioxygenase YbiX
MILNQPSFSLHRNVVHVRSYEEDSARSFLERHRDDNFHRSQIYRTDTKAALIDDSRTSKQADIHPSDQHMQRLAELTRKVNHSIFVASVDRYCFETNFLRYDKGDQFTKHNDMILPKDPSRIDRHPIRKLTTIQLISDPDQFMGGELRFFYGEVRFRMEMGFADVFIFPSYVNHVVEPLQSGTRYSIVSWSHGRF